MKDILVMTNRSDDFSRISKVLSDAYNIKQAGNLETAKTMHETSAFDMIMADIELLEPGVEKNGFHFSTHPFVRANPFVQFVVLCERAHLTAALKAVKEGAAGYIVYPAGKKDIQLLLLTVNRTISRDIELDYLRDHFWKTEWLEIIRSKNPKMKEIYKQIRSVAPTGATVLLLGETGTGKGLLARLIHWHSRRYEKPFVSVHCGAIPDTLLESELFGHEKGAFTGADHKKPGKFETARDGTIFLDEIGTITFPAQIKLLQVLQDGTFNRIGGDYPLRPDVRIIAATNAQLDDLVQSGGFRKDLYYRLNVFPIHIPPLRERLEDLGYLIDIFIKNLNVKYGKNMTSIDPAAIQGFNNYDWPGNIRELENIIERAYILEQSNCLWAHNFPAETMAFSGRPPDIVDMSAPLAGARQQAVHQFERTYLTRLLETARGRIGPAAGQAGITTRQLNRLLTRHGIDKRQFKK